MNPFVCASFAFLLTVSQAVAVAAEGERPKPTSKKSIPLIVGIIVAVVVGMPMPCYQLCPSLLTRFLGPSLDHRCPYYFDQEAFA